MRASIRLFLGGLKSAARALPQAWRSCWLVLALTALAVALAIDRGAGWWLLAAVLALIAKGRLWRAAMKTGRSGPVEVRLAAVWLLTAVFLAILALLLLVVLLCCAYAVASAGPGFDAAQIASWRPAIAGRGEALLGAIGLVGLAALALAAARVSLAEPATVSRGQVQVLSAWPLTRDRALALLAGHATIVAPIIALTLFRWPGLSWMAAESLVVAGLWLPASVGFMAYAYESRTGDA